MEEYNSSETLQRNNADVFANKEAEAARKKAEENKTQRDVNRGVIDKYIEMHSSTVKVRKLAKEQTRGAQYQLDLSADIVETLEKIKSEIR